MLKQEAQPTPASDSGPEPDVWWGEHGIDALIWADGQPYEELTDMPAPDYALMSGDAQ